MPVTAARIIAAALLTLAAAGCGFKPIYATPTGENSALNQRIAIRSVAGAQTINPIVVDALERRMPLKDGVTPEYDLYVTVSERAERLAVQIDNTTTRYNYRLRGRYTVIDLDTGRRINGRAEAVTSYNIVSSQYSTLFAENTAREKAAGMLAEEIERSLLLRFAREGAFDEPEEEGDFPDYTIDPRTNTLIDESRRTNVPDPFSTIPSEVVIEAPAVENSDSIDVPDPQTEE